MVVVVVVVVSVVVQAVVIDLNVFDAAAITLLLPLTLSLMI